MGFFLTSKDSSKKRYHWPVSALWFLLNVQNRQGLQSIKMQNESQKVLAKLFILYQHKVVPTYIQYLYTLQHTFKVIEDRVWSEKTSIFFRRLKKCNYVKSAAEVVEEAISSPSKFKPKEENFKWSKIAMFQIGGEQLISHPFKIAQPQPPVKRAFPNCVCFYI